MKIVAVILSAFVIIGCTSKQVQLNEGKKIIQLKCTLGEDTLNTFNNTFTRVYRDTGIYVIDFYFTIEEQQRIISEIGSVNFFDLPDSLAHKNLNSDENSKIEDIVFRFPGDRDDQSIEVLLNGKNKKVYWIDYASYTDSEEYIRLNSVMKIIYEIVLIRKEIRELPTQVWY